MLESDSNRLRDLAPCCAKSISISNYYATKLVDLKLEFDFAVHTAMDIRLRTVTK